MKLKNLFLVLAIFPVLSFANCTLKSSGMASGNHFNGFTTCSGSPTDSISVNGTLTVSDTKINQASVKGNVTTTNATITNSSIVGNLTGINSTFSNASVTGDANLTYSNVDNLTVNGTVRLSNSKVNNITASGDNSWFSRGDKIYLTENSVVSGNITFAHGNNGIVYVSGGSKVLGTVSGGTVQNQ